MLRRTAGRSCRPRLRAT
uniref:Uncharacterized protein n=1 Tax=Arundo donax TaxID=35708 RepID=A0A0A8YXY8_ARUDO